MRLCRLVIILLAFVSFTITAFAQDPFTLKVTYVCNGERIYIDSCNIRDTSDTSSCMVMHPDHVNANGMATAVYLTRAQLKQLLPTCQQPSAQQVAAHDAFVKKQQAALDAATPKYAPAPTVTVADVQNQLATGGSKDPQEIAMRRCIAAGRLPSSCTGNALLGAFSGMISSTLSGLTGKPDPNSPSAAPVAGPVMSGVFQGSGNWRLDFIDGGVLVNCSFLSANEEYYDLSLANNRATLTVKTTPKPLVLQVHMDGTITGPAGPVTIDGVIATGYHSGLHNAMGQEVSASEAMHSSMPIYNENGQEVKDASGINGYTTFSKRTATCPGINLSSKGASVGIQTMQMNVLKSAFGGDTGPATPAGIRMTGIFATSSTGFSVEFFPESAVVGCGPLSARAYPYTVVADGTKSVVTIAAADKPLTLSIRGDGSLDPGSRPYLVHGRMLIGETVSDDYRFMPLEMTCNLGALTPAKAIPSSGGTAVATMPAGLR